jgi:hypothetical protein
MERLAPDMNKRKRKRVKILLWIFSPLFFLIPVFIGIFTDRLSLISIISIFLGITGIFTIIYISDNYYKWPLVLFIVFYIGLLFKNMHWPLAGAILSISTFVLLLVSIVIIIRFLFNFKQHQFIRWFGVATALITSTIMSGWVIMLQHWNRNLGILLGYSGSILMIITVLAMVFTLPNSNYISWSSMERKIFFRIVLIPMVLIFFITTINLVFPEAWAALMNTNSIRWGLDGIELLKLEGIPVL